MRGRRVGLLVAVLLVACGSETIPTRAPGSCSPWDELRPCRCWHGDSIEVCARTDAGYYEPFCKCLGREWKDAGRD